MLPPLPPSPPSGPPYSTNFSLLKLMQPAPPSPAFRWILASSRNFIIRDSYFICWTSTNDFPEDFFLNVTKPSVMAKIV